MQKTKNEIIYRLKTGKKKGTYTLKSGIANIDGNLKNISYRPGTSSIVDEDNKDSVVKARPVTFKFNNQMGNPAVEISVPKANKLLNNFLQSHQKFNIDYEIYDEDAIAAQKVNKYNNVEKAFSYVNLSDENEIKASALAVFGMDYFNKSVNICEQDLKKAAYENPEKVIGVYENEAFHSRHMASLMYGTRVIENNPTSTAVVWADTKGVIVHITQGESGIDKLTSFLHKDSPESQSLMQEFSKRVDTLAKPKVSADLSKELSAKEKEIEELKAQLAKASVKSIEVSGEMTLEQASEAYKLKTGNDVPIRYKNDLEWINSKLIQE